jgi:hypothetical protein
MARPKKSVVFNADDQTIVEFFDQAMMLKANQRDVSSEISGLNVLMQESGVDPGTLSLCCRLAKMKEGKRGVAVALLHRYLVVLASRLEDPTITVEVPAAPAEAGRPVPFEHVPGAVAA